ncbi:MAG: hypothetical protein V5A74_07235, partial [Desulfohalobiaceae bacterium]
QAESEDNALRAACSAGCGEAEYVNQAHDFSIAGEERPDKKQAVRQGWFFLYENVSNSLNYMEIQRGKPGMCAEAVFHKRASPCSSRYGDLAGSDSKVRDATGLWRTTGVSRA